MCGADDDRSMRMFFGVNFEPIRRPNNETVPVGPSTDKIFCNEKRGLENSSVRARSNDYQNFVNVDLARKTRITKKKRTNNIFNKPRAQNHTCNKSCSHMICSWDSHQCSMLYLLAIFACDANYI